jgi:uncharacterized protein
MLDFFELKLISFIFSLFSQLGIAASFDCAKATTSMEKLICSIDRIIYEKNGESVKFDGVF